MLRGSALAAEGLNFYYKTTGGMAWSGRVIPPSNWDIDGGSDKSRIRGSSWSFLWPQGGSDM